MRKNDDTCLEELNMIGNGSMRDGDDRTVTCCSWRWLAGESSLLLTHHYIYRHLKGFNFLICHMVFVGIYRSSVEHTNLNKGNHIIISIIQSPIFIFIFRYIFSLI